VALIGPRGRRALRLAHRFYDEQRALFEYAARSRRSVTLEPRGQPQGTVLFSYLLETFLSDDPLPMSHTNFWESHQIAQTFVELGFTVEVISFQNHAYLTRRRGYDFLVSLRTNLEKLAPQVGDDCVKVLHADVAHVLFHNAAEANRLLALQQRRGITLPPRRYSPPNLAIEHADCATVNGNEFTMSTYAYAGKPLHRLHKAALSLHPHPGEKDIEASRRRFLWLGSAGFVHKGLDLVLEAFAGLPELELVVAAPLDEEPDFVAAFEHELRECPNIRALGWVNVASADFDRLAGTCIGVVYPSSSEGGGGSVLDCLHAGLIPILTREASVDINGFGTLLRAAGVEEVRDAVRAVVDAPAAELRERSAAAWTFARECHTRERFASDYRAVVEGLLSGRL
jgi:glycosyltransferase involved in cell wall biosynthesis